MRSAFRLLGHKSCSDFHFAFRRRGERRALHAHSALFEATSGASQQTPSGTGQTRDGMATKLPLKKVKSLGVEVDAAMILSRDNGRQMGDKDAGQGVDSILESKLAVGDVPKTTESSAKKGKPTSVTGEKKEDSQGASVQVEGHTVEGRLPRVSSVSNECDNFQILCVQLQECAYSKD